MPAAAHPGDDPVEHGIERHRPGDLADRHVGGDSVVVTVGSTLVTRATIDG